MAELNNDRVVVATVGGKRMKLLVPSGSSELKASTLRSYPAYGDAVQVVLFLATFRGVPTANAEG